MRPHYSFSPLPNLILESNSDSRGSGGSSKSSSSPSGVFHAPPKPGELQSISTGTREATAPENDPAISLLETLQAVKEKQQSSHIQSQQNEKNIDDIAGVQSDRSPLQRLMSAQIAVFGGSALILVLSIWGLITLAQRATQGINPTDLAAKSQNSERSGEVAPATPAAARPAETSPPPSEPATPPTALTRPAFRSTPGGATGGAIRLHNNNLSAADKERLEREEQERTQREKVREEEERQERERQLRELEGRDGSENNAEVNPTPENTPPAATEEGAPSAPAGNDNP